ncbi:hypothetical protein H5T88_06005 [bacterium]|nr:hypothetical protein [bacterium]
MRLTFLLLFIGGLIMCQEYLLTEDFEAGKISSIWRLQIGAGKSFVEIERRNGGNCLHLFGDHSSTSISTSQNIPNIAYTLEYDFFQPSEEVGGYQAVVNHHRPQGNSYWWLEYGPQRFFLYTISGGIWFNRWQAQGIPSNRWLHIKIQNTPTSVKVWIYDEAGKQLSESPQIPHDDGDPAPVFFSAVGEQRGVWGMKIDNIRLYITPIEERADYRFRKKFLELARASLSGEDMDKLVSAFNKISSVSPSDWQSYVSAIKFFDTVAQQIGEEYHDKVISKLEKRQNDWVMLDIWEHFNSDSLTLSIPFPFNQPISNVEGIPFLTIPFGRNCLWQDLPSRSQHSIPLNAQAGLVALLLAPVYDVELYGHDDSLVDVLQVELRYADGFKERIFPTPSDWQPPLPYGVGNPPISNRKVKAYIVQPSHSAPISQIVLCDGGIQAGWALFAISYKPGIPSISSTRAILKEKRKITPFPAEAVQTEYGISLDNAYFHILFDRERGAIKEFSSPLIGDIVSFTNPSPLFAIQSEKGELFYSDSFQLGRADIKKLAYGVNLNLTYKGVKELENLRVIVDVKAGREGAMKWQATLVNDSQVTIKVRLIFPLMDGLYLGEKVGWFFPQRGGAVSELPLEGLASYGGMAWLQLLDIFRQEGGGIYVRCDDTQGIYKIFSLRWSPKEEISPRRVADIPEPAHPIDAWRAKVGAHLSIQYLPTKLQPGESISSPPATISVHDGDWHKALEDYRDWLKTWWKPLRPCPERYKYGFYALVGGAPADNQKGEEFGSYDWWHLSPFWTIDYPDELKNEIEGMKKQAERASKWGQAVGIYIEGMVLEKKRKIAKERGAEWAMMDDKGNYYTYYSSEENPVWNMCPAVKEWQKWDAWAYSEIAKRVPLCAMYVDSTGSRWAEVCYNPAHKHPTPGIWVKGCGELFETIRQEVMKVNPNIAIHSEEPGSDYMALHEDGSWSHSLWTNLSGDIEYNPAGLNYFRFVLPQFKMYEIPSYRHALWRCKLAFFNGEGLWTNQPDALRRELFIRWMPTLRENADVFLSEDVEPALPLLSPPLYINRFRRGEQTIYTIYNAGLRTQFANLRLPIPSKGHIFDLLNLREISFIKEGNEAVFDISVDPHDVLCFLITPKKMDLELEGDKLKVNLSGVKAKELWVAGVDEEGIRRDIQRFPLKGKEIVIEREKLPSNARKLLLRLPLPHSTEDIVSVVF